jgi:hypothetical protein
MLELGNHLPMSPNPKLETGIQSTNFNFVRNNRQLVSIMTACCANWLA